jgi:hypothetical protein
MQYKLLSALFFILMIVSFCLCFKSCQESESKSSMLQAVQDSLRITVDKHGRQTGTIAVLQGSVKDLTNDVKSKEETILRVQAQAKKYKGDLVAVTAINVTLRDSLKGWPTARPGDTVREGGITYVYMAYDDTLSTEWASYQIHMDRHSSSIISDIKSKLDIVQAYERPIGKSFLTKKELVVKVTTLNPNTGIDKVHSFHVAPKKQYTGAIAAVSALLGFVLGSR